MIDRYPDALLVKYLYVCMQYLPHIHSCPEYNRFYSYSLEIAVAKRTIADQCHSYSTSKPVIETSYAGSIQNSTGEDATRNQSHHVALTVQ